MDRFKNYEHNYLYYLLINCTLKNVFSLQCLNNNFYANSLELIMFLLKFSAQEISGKQKISK